MTDSPAALPEPRWRTAALVLLFFAIVVLLQFLSGAYRSEFSGYPDESAHYVTSLMVRDFIAGLDYTEPMTFARNYYDHYPKVAFGHWPPLLYALGGVWMLVFSPSRASVLLGLAVIAAVLAWMVYNTVKSRFGWVAGALSGAFLLCIPIVQTYSDEVMAESLLAVTSFAATLYFARYLESLRWQDSALFGIFAALAILTKGSGWDLALIPPIALLLTRQFSVLMRRDLWLSALIVAAICGPWQFMTMDMAQRGWDGGDRPSLTYTLHALPAFLPILADLLGWGLLPLVLIGAAATLVRRRIEPLWASLFGLILADWLFHSVVPAGVEDRKLIIAVPAMILFLVAGIFWLANRFRWKPVLIAGFALFLFGVQKFSIPREIHFGYTEAAHFIEARKEFQDANILVSSQRDGEGMLISELAMCDKRPSHRILRGTKVLSRTDWNGHVFAFFYRTPEAFLAYLHDANIRLVVSDTLPSASTFEHQRVLQETVSRYPDRLTLIASFTGATKGAVNVYRVK